MSSLLEKTERHVLRAHTGQAGFFSGLKGAKDQVFLSDRAGRKNDVEVYNKLFSEFSLPGYAKGIADNVSQLSTVEAQRCINNIYNIILSLTNPDELDSAFSRVHYDMIFNLSQYIEELKKLEPLPQDLTDALLPVVHTIFVEYGRECRHDFFQFFNKRKNNELLRSINESFRPISYIFDSLSAEFSCLANRVNSIVNTSVTQYSNAVVIPDSRTIDTIRSKFELSMEKTEKEASLCMKAMSVNLECCINNSTNLLAQLQDLYSKCIDNLGFSLCSEGLYAGEARELSVDVSLGEEFLSEVKNNSEKLLSFFKTKDADSYINAREFLSQMKSHSGMLPHASGFIHDCYQQLFETHPEYARMISSQISIYNTVQQIFINSVEECIYFNYLYSKFNSGITDGSILSLLRQEEFVKMVTDMRDNLNRMREHDGVVLPGALLDSVDQLFRLCKKFADNKQAIENIDILESSVKSETCNETLGEDNCTQQEITLLLAGMLAESPDNSDDDDLDRSKAELKLWREKALTRGATLSAEYTNLSSIAKCCASFNDAYEELKSKSGRVLLNRGTARELLKDQFDAFRDMYNELPDVYSSVMQVLLGFGHEKTEITANDSMFWDNVGNKISLIHSPLSESASTEDYIDRYKVLCDFHSQVIRYCSALSKKVLNVIDINLGGFLSMIPEGASPVNNVSEIPRSVKEWSGFKRLVKSLNKGHGLIVRNTHSTAEDFELINEVSVYNLALAARENAVHTLSTVFLTPRKEDQFISDGLIFSETVAHTTLAQMDYILQDIVKNSDLVKPEAIDVGFRQKYWEYARGIINIFAEMYLVNPLSLDANYSAGGDSGVMGVFKLIYHKFKSAGKTGITESYFLMLAMSGNFKFMGFEIDDSINSAQVELALKRQSYLEREH